MMESLLKEWSVGEYLYEYCSYDPFEHTLTPHYAHIPHYTTAGASMSAGGAEGGDGEGEGYGADQQGEDDQINEMMAGSDAELQVCAVCGCVCIFQLFC